MTEHQFGGSAMDRHVFEFEAIADPVEAAAPVEAPAADAPDAPVADAPVETPAAVPAADPFADLGIDSEGLRELAELAPVLRNVLTQQPPAAAQPEAPPQLDPFAEDFGEQLVNLMRSVVGEAVQPLAAHTEQQQQAEQQSLLKDAAHDVETRKGEFIGDEDAKEFARDQMLSLARQMFPQVAQRYGMTDRAADMALEQAYDRVRSWQDSTGNAAVERYKNSLSTLANAPAEPGSETTAVVRTPSGFRDEVEMARRWGG